MANLTIRAGVIEETLLVDIVKDGLEIIKNAFVKYANISLDFVYISKFEVAELDPFVTLPDMDTLLFPLDYNLMLVYESFNVSRVSGMFRPTWTFILSPPPLAETKSSLTFLNLETEVTCAFIFSLILVSVAMSIFETSTKMVQKIRRRGRRRRQLGFKIFFRKLKDYLWQNLFLFFFEPYEITPSSNPWRIAFLCWLFCVMVVNVEINSYLKSEFSETEFAYINTITDLLANPRTGVKIGIVEEGVEDRYISRKSAENENFKKLFRILRDDQEGELMDVSNLVYGDLWEEIRDGKLILISSSMTVLATMTHKFYRFDDDLSLFDYKGIYYFSPSILNSYSALVYSGDFAKSHFAELMDQLLMINLECRLAERVIMRTYFMMDFLRWTEPSVESTQLSFTGAQSVIVLYLIGNAISIAYFLIAFNLKAFKGGRKSRRYGNRTNVDLGE